MITQIAILVILIGLNAFFAASEIAFIALNDTKIEKQAKEGNKKAKQIEKMLETPSKFLSTIQIGITLAGFLSSAFASDAFASKLAPVLNNMIPIGINIWQNISILIITIILSFFTIVFGELVPKRLAMKHYEKIAFATIGIIRTISIITAPFVKLLSVTTNAISKIFGVGENEEEIVTEEEIKMMVDQGKEDGTIQEDEKEYINNVFEFNDIVASEIMTHRTDMFAVDINTGANELLEEIIKDDCKHSRIPVYDETVDEIKGILYVKDIIKNIGKKTFKIKNIMKEAYFVSQNKLINELFKEMQKNKKQMAIVVDEYGGTAGLITMEDILEEIVGDIFDEYDEFEEEYEKIDDKTYIISGKMPIYDVNKLLNSNIPEGDYDTLSGYLQEELGRIPTDEENPIIETKELTFKIEEYEDKRIIKVKVCKNQTEE
ncbi:cBS domain-containing protein [Clostridium sp. CAG:356]|nr:MAG: hemolysin [Clostridium sp. 28_12]CDD37152.1 cBS domain-containing protein [Clostridium sp. CAG:356]